MLNIDKSCSPGEKVCQEHFNDFGRKGNWKTSGLPGFFAIEEEICTTNGNRTLPLMRKDSHRTKLGGRKVKSDISNSAISVHESSAAKSSKRRKLMSF